MRDASTAVIAAPNLISGLSINFAEHRGAGLARRTDLEGAMRNFTTVVVVALLFAGCADKSTTKTPKGGTATTATSGGSGGAAAPAAARAGGAAQQPATGGRSAGAQAAARMTPDQLDAAMKTINSTNGTLGMKLMSNDLPGASKDGQTLATTFADVERFWAQANKPDAVKLAQQARMAASETAAAALAGDGMKAAAARSNMTATCKQCHGLYREGDAQSGYRIKAGVL